MASHMSHHICRVSHQIRIQNTLQHIALQAKAYHITGVTHHGHHVRAHMRTHNISHPISPHHNTSYHITSSQYHIKYTITSNHITSRAHHIWDIGTGHIKTHHGITSQHGHHHGHHIRTNHVTSHHITSHHRIMSNHIISHHITSHQNTLHITTSDRYHHITSEYITSHQNASRINASRTISHSTRIRTENGQRARVTQLRGRDVICCIHSIRRHDNSML